MVTQDERLNFLLRYLLAERKEYENSPVPGSLSEKRRLLRSLMVAEQTNRKIPTALIPRCPVCGAPMSMNLRADDTFVEDEVWHTAARRYEDFLRRHEKQHILFLELGVGGNTPVIIKYPFWRMTYQNPKAAYTCINLLEAYCPREIQKQAICMNEDIGNILHQLLLYGK